MNIYQKLIEVRKSCEYLKKENDGAQYKYVSSSQTLASLKDKMNELGLLLVPSITRTEVDTDTVEQPPDKYGKVKRTATYFTQIWVDYRWVNAENPEESIISSWYGQGVDVAGEKGVGKALTYAEKYFMLKFFNIATDKDDPDSFQKKYDDAPATPKDSIKQDLSNDAANEKAASLCEEIDKCMTHETLIAWGKASKKQIDTLPETQKAKVRSYWKQVEAMILEVQKAEQAA